MSTLGGPHVRVSKTCPVKSSCTTPVARGPSVTNSCSWLGDNAYFGCIRHEQVLNGLKYVEFHHFQTRCIRPVLSWLRKQDGLTKEKQVTLKEKRCHLHFRFWLQCWSLYRVPTHFPFQKSHSFLGRFSDHIWHLSTHSKMFIMQIKILKSNFC